LNKNLLGLPENFYCEDDISMDIGEVVDHKPTPTGCSCGTKDCPGVVSGTNSIHELIGILYKYSIYREDHGPCKIEEKEVNDSYVEISVNCPEPEYDGSLHYFTNLKIRAKKERKCKTLINAISKQTQRKNKRFEKISSEYSIPTFLEFTPEEYQKVVYRHGKWIDVLTGREIQQYKKEKVPRFLYHATIGNRLRGICEKGLRSQYQTDVKTWSPVGTALWDAVGPGTRVNLNYFFGSYNSAKQQARKTGNEIGQPGAVCKVDTTKLKNCPFLYDPEYYYLRNHYTTPCVVPPKAMKCTIKGNVPDWKTCKQILK